MFEIIFMLIVSVVFGGFLACIACCKETYDEDLVKLS